MIPNQNPTLSQSGEDESTRAQGRRRRKGSKASRVDQVWGSKGKREERIKPVILRNLNGPIGQGDASAEQPRTVVKREERGESC